MHVIKGNSKYVNSPAVDHIYTFTLYIWPHSLWEIFYFSWINLIMSLVEKAQDIEKCQWFSKTSPFLYRDKEINNASVLNFVLNCSLWRCLEICVLPRRQKWIDLPVGFWALPKGAEIWQAIKTSWAVVFDLNLAGWIKPSQKELIIFRTFCS